MKKYKQNGPRARIIHNESTYLEKQFLSNFVNERDYCDDRMESIFDEIDYKCQKIGISYITFILYYALRTHAPS